MEGDAPVSEIALDCDSFEEFNASIRGWATDFRQVERGLAVVRLRHRMTEGLNALDVQFSHSTVSTGAVQAGYRTFGMPDVVAGCSWCGHDVGQQHILRFDAHDEFATVTPRRFVGRTLAVEEGLLHSIASDLGYPDILADLDRSPDILSVRPGAVAAFRRLYDSPMPDTWASRVLIEQLVVLLGSTAEAPAAPRQSSRSRTVDEALALICSKAREPVTVADLCRELGVGYRALDRAFKQRLGSGPKRSILAVRLQGVRSELKAADPSSPIADIANGWGFWHMGDFARLYREEFGELPSETRRAG